MRELPDYDIRTSGDPAPPRVGPPSRPPVAGIVAAALIVAALAAAYVYLRRAPADEVTSAPPQTTAPAAQTPARPLGGEAQQIDLPPLGQTDPLVRRLVRELSTHPRLLAWLATDGLIRNFVVVVENIAYGTNPAPRLQALRPAGGFRAAGAAEAPVVDERSYERWNTFADAVASVDPQGAADLYATLKPRLNEAWAELGRTGTLDDAVARAVSVLLATPVRDGEIRLTPAAVGYRYADPALERLAPAQKQLLRMGPRNARMIQERLREIGRALGMSGDAAR